MTRLNESTIVLVVGGTGSVGNIVVDKLLKLGLLDIRVLARDESKRADLLSKFHNNASKITPIIGDVRDAQYNGL